MTAAPAPTAGHGRGSPSTGRLLWGMALLGAGFAWLLDAAGVADVTVARVVAVALIALGGVVAFLPARDRGPAVALGMVLVLVAVLTIVARPVGDLALVRHGVGDRHVAPASASQLQASYEHGVGNVVVDLHRVVVPEGTTDVEVRLGAGDLRVRIPPDATVRVDARAGMGDVAVLDDQRGGVGPSLTGDIAGATPGHTLRLDASVGLGRVEVTR